MKRSLYIITLLCAFAFAPQTYAQGFLGKISKGLDKVTEGANKVSDALSGKNTEQKSTPAQNNAPAKETASNASTTLPGLDIKCVKVVHEGSRAVAYFACTNNTGRDLSLNFLGSQASNPSVILDANGTRYNGGMAHFGNQTLNGYFYSGEDTPFLPEGATIKGRFFIDEFPASMNMLKSIRLSLVNPKDRKFYTYVFNDLPVETVKNTNVDFMTCDYPAIFVTYKSLEAVGKNMVLTLVIKNTDMKGQTINIRGGAAYTDDGDVYKLSYADNSLGKSDIFERDTPIRVSFTFENAARVKDFTSIRIEFTGDDNETYKIQLKNISIQ